ncbi:peptidyl-prolyl cis-trans isomerase [Bacteroidia bacterium]|nr:peptidyl-prolyl cis-trans isomerase [Bacteroidia bacterium]
MKKLLNVSMLSLLVFVGIALFSCNAQVPKAELKNEVDSVSYAQGVMLASQQIDRIYQQFGFDEANKADFIKGFQEGFSVDPKDKKTKAIMIGRMIGHDIGSQGIPYFNEQLFGNDSTQSLNKKDFLAGYLSAISQPDSLLPIGKNEAQMYAMATAEKIRKASMEKQYAAAKQENEDFLEKNKSAEGVVTLPSGLQYKVITEGKGLKPAATDKVKVDYEGKLIDGKVFDSSIQRGTPAEFPVSGVIPGWVEGLQLMPVGSKYMFYIPYNLAYGENGNNAIPPFSTLVFEVTLHEIVK